MNTKTNTKIGSVLLGVCALAVACSGKPGDDVGSAGSQAVTTQITNVTFNTDLHGNFVGAVNNGGGDVIASATVAREWETFALIDKNGGALVSGDSVFIKVGTGQYFQAVNGGGGSMNA